MELEKGTRSKSMFRWALAGAALAIVGSLALGADWPQWRGPGRDGVVADFEPPAKWPDKLIRKWSVDVGEGHSSPIVADGAIFIHARQGEEEVVRRIDPSDGAIRWEARLTVPYEMHPSALEHGKGPKSTPVASSGRLYTLGITGILSCFEMESGKVVWRREFSNDFPSTSPLFGVAMSPLVDGDLVMAHVGGHDKGSFMAFDAATGETRWRWNGDGPGYASPIVVEIGGVRQIVTQSQDHIISLDRSTGELLWELPFSTNYYQNSVTPLAFRDLIVFSGLDSGLWAVRPILKDGVWTPETVWKTTRASLYMNTPVLVGDILFGLSHKRRGQFVAIDAASGEMMWGSPGREGENASIVAAGDLLFLLTTDSELIIAKATRAAYEIVARYSVADTPTWAHPAPLANGVVVKDLKTLTRWSWEDH